MVEITDTNSLNLLFDGMGKSTFNKLIQKMHSEIMKTGYGKEKEITISIVLDEFEQALIKQLK